MNNSERVQPSISYICQAWVPGAGLLYTFRIDQQVPRPAKSTDVQRVTNQVQTHLSGLSDRTGLSYSMLYWADPERVDDYIARNNLEVH